VTPIALPSAYAATRVRGPPTFPFGWGAVTVLLVGAVFLIIGLLIIVYGMIGFFSGFIGAAVSDSFSIGTFFQSFFGAIMLFVIGGVLAGVGGWLVRLWWIFLLVGAVTGAGGGSTVREREEMRAGDVRVRCRNCGRLNPESARFCMSCSQPV